MADNRPFDSTNLILYIYRWRKPLIGFSLAAAVLAVIFSAPYFIPPKYKSTVVVFPSTTNSVSKAVLPQQFATKGQDVLEFGDEQEAEQLLQILNSDEIRTKIIEKYDLIKHYRIDTTGKYVMTQLYKTYEGNISFRRTEFMSVVIEVLDTDPDTAAAIANDIVVLLNDVKNRIQKERAEMGLKIVETEYHTLLEEVQAREDKITTLRFKGVHDYESQSSVFNEQLAIALVESGGKRTAAVQDLQARLDTLAKYGGLYVSLRDELVLLKEETVRLKSRYDQAKVDVSQSLPVVFKVNDAFPAERKTYPVRSIIVLVATLATFLFTLVVILIVDTIRKGKAPAAA